MLTVHTNLSYRSHSKCASTYSGAAFIEQKKADVKILYLTFSHIKSMVLVLLYYKCSIQGYYLASIFTLYLVTAC